MTLDEAHQYALMTLKQHGAEHLRVRFTNTKRRLGCFSPWKEEIHIAKRALFSFELFREILLHELAHHFDFQERGTFRTNGRNDFHGKNWKKWCLTLGVRARRFIPVN